MKGNNTEVETTDRELRLARLFEAPRHMVFQAYSSCEHLSNWWGPPSWPMVECRLDFRVGGEWHYCLRGPNPEDESWGKAVYEEIVEPERLIYRDYFADADGNVNEDMPKVLSTLEFIDQAGKTLLRIRAAYEDPAALQQVLEMGMVEGLTETLDRLEEHLARAD